MSSCARSIYVKRSVLCLLLMSCVAFSAMLFAPSSQQLWVYPCWELCDYRFFIQPTIANKNPYCPKTIPHHDSCYPPVAYCAVKALVNDKGVGWRLTPGEWRYILSLALMQVIGVLFLVWRIPSSLGRIVGATVLVMTQYGVRSVLSGNPSSWSFAFVCVFVCWHNSRDALRRIAAAVSLGLATSLKIAPCVFGCMYLSAVFEDPKSVPWKDIALAAATAVVLTFLPFAFFGGFGSVAQWISNAAANSAFYSLEGPMWGIVPLFSQVVGAGVKFQPWAGALVWASRGLALMLVASSIFVKGAYRKLLFVGAAMAFLTCHDYGGIYLLPAFVFWLCDTRAFKCRYSGVALLLDAVAWFFLLTSLQIPNPNFLGPGELALNPVLNWGVLNPVLQNDSLFVLLFVAIVFGIDLKKDGGNGQKLDEQPIRR